MSKSVKTIPFCFTMIMLIFILIVSWYLPAVSSLRFEIDDIEKSIETSQGRERKQQYEYAQVSEELPLVQAELNKTLPLVQEAEEKVKLLKEERKKLREIKKELETAIEESNSREEQNDD